MFVSYLLTVNYCRWWSWQKTQPWLSGPWLYRQSTMKTKTYIVSFYLLC